VGLFLALFALTLGASIFDVFLLPSFLGLDAGFADVARRFLGVRFLSSALFSGLSIKVRRRICHFCAVRRFCPFSLFLLFPPGRLIPFPRRSPLCPELVTLFHNSKPAELAVDWGFPGVTAALRALFSFEMIFNFG